jgi:hypothetical protein
MNYLKKTNKKYFDPIVFSNDCNYNPWGKPGGGAPLTERGSSKLKTKIEGRMQWNLNGQTPSARKRNKLFNSAEHLPIYDSQANQLYSGSSENLTFIEKQAELRNLQRKSRKMYHDGHESFNYETQTNGLPMDIENYSDDNYANLWFGRQGGGAPIDDKRRQKLIMRLEDRSPNDFTNGTIKKVYHVDPMNLKRLPHERFYEP